jgi:RNA 2',3'-cyclic 3'-phosphodiesterase
MGRDRGAPPPAKPLRLFVAADVPDDVKADLAAFLEPFRDRVPGAGWTRRDGWHVTLRFLGSTWPRQVEAVRTAVEKAAAAISPFETSLTEVGAFPSERRARVLWVGLADEGKLFQEIVTLLDDLLKEDFVPDERDFTPHLTVARLHTVRDLSEFARDLHRLSVASRTFPVGELVLYQSHLSPRGATYDALGRFPFTGS